MDVDGCCRQLFTGQIRQVLCGVESMQPDLEGKVDNIRNIRHTSRLAPRTSHLTPHTSHLTPHTSHLTTHNSQLTPHTLHLTPRAGPIIIALADRDSVLEGLDDYCNQEVKIAATSATFAAAGAGGAAAAADDGEPSTPGIRTQNTYTFDRFPLVLGLHLNRYYQPTVLFTNDRRFYLLAVDGCI